MIATTMLLLITMVLAPCPEVSWKEKIGEMALRSEKKMDIETKFSLLSFSVKVQRNLNASGSSVTDTENTTLAEVIQLATHSARQLVEAAKGLEPLNLETSNTNFQQVFTWDKDNRVNIHTGYKADLGITVKVYNNQTEEAVSQLLDSGKPYVFLNSLQFLASQESKDAAERDLKTKALEEIKQELDIVLDQWNVCFMNWKHINMNANRRPSPIVRMLAFEGMAALHHSDVAAVVPVVAGVESVIVTVSATAKITPC